MSTATPFGPYPSYKIVWYSAPPASAPEPRLTARSMLSLGTELFLAFWIASKSVGLPSGSPPPVRAATSMFLISFANILPRRASMTAFLCLVVAHLECPLMPVPSPLQNATPCYRRCRGVPLVGGAAVGLAGVSGVTLRTLNVRSVTPLTLAGRRTPPPPRTSSPKRPRCTFGNGHHAAVRR